MEISRFFAFVILVGISSANLITMVFDASRNVELAQLSTLNGKVNTLTAPLTHQFPTSCLEASHRLWWTNGKQLYESDASMQHTYGPFQYNTLHSIAGMQFDSKKGQMFAFGASNASNVAVLGQFVPVSASQVKFTEVKRQRCFIDLLRLLLGVEPPRLPPHLPHIVRKAETFSFSRIRWCASR